MATLAARGSGTPVTSGTTWASLTHAVDGTAGTNPATYATYTNATASAVGYIEISGYGFDTSVGASDTLNSVTVNLRHFENNTGRFASVRFQPYDGATAIGSIFTATLATAARNDSTTFPVTLAQLRSSTFKIRVTVTGAASTQSRVESIDYVDVTADYTPLPPAITQAAYRFFADGTETGATALAAQDTGYTADTSGGDVNLQVRARLQSTNAVTVAATDDWQLQWERNTSGTWGNVELGEALVDTWASSNHAGAGFQIPGAVATTAVGQSFLGNGRLLSRLRFYVIKTGTVNGTVTAALYAHTGTFGSTSKPTGTALAASTTTINSVDLTVGSYVWVNFNFASTVTLVNGTPYVAVVSTTSTGDASNTVLVGVAGTAHAGNRSTLQGSTWTDFTSNDLIFEVYAGPAVTPTTVVPYASANLTDGAATTNRLGAGSGTFVAGKISETGLVTDLGWTANNYTEVLYSVTLKQADLAPTDTVKFRVLRNGATTGLTFTQVPTVTIGAAGPVDRTGTATGSITVAGSSAGTKDVTGIATGTLTVAGAAAGAPGAAGTAVTGTAVGALTVAGVSTGVHGVAATATGALAVAGTAAGTKQVRATATGTLTVAGVSSGVRDTRGAATGTVALAGTATGVRTFNGVATGALTVTGTASGVKQVAATATGSLTVAGSSTGHRVFTGTATGSLTLAGAATGLRTAAATATGAITVAGTATATKQVVASATGQVVLGSSALGLVEGNAVGTAVGAITVTGTATGARGTRATATGQLTLSGTAVARRGTAAVATGTLTLAGAATATKTVTATATGTITLAGTAAGGAPVTFEIIGEWNDQQVDALQWGSDSVVEWFMLTAVQVNATATGGLTLGGAATGYSTKQGHATGTLTFTGSSTGTGTTPAGTDVLLEPFNNYTDNGWVPGGNATIVTGRTGTAAQASGAASNNAAYNLAAPAQTDTITFGFAWRYTDANTAIQRDIVSLYSDAGVTQHNRITYQRSITRVNFTRAATTLGFNAAVTMNQNTWYYIEVQTKLHDTTGFGIVRVDGVEIINTGTSVDTKNAGTKTVFDQLRLGSNATGAVGQWDDLYITVGVGAPFKGNITIP